MMTSQCIRCGGVLEALRRSPLCPRCWTEHNRARNREKVQAFRERGRAASASNSDEGPTSADLNWLDALDLGLAEPVARLFNLQEEGRGLPDPAWVATGFEILQKYDSQRDEFERRALL